MKKEYRNSTRTKKMIRSAFVDLIEEKKLLNSITVAELAERADIAKSTFYNHYDDVYSVADEIMQELMEELDEIIDAMEADNTKDYRIYISRIFSFIKENQNIQMMENVENADALLEELGQYRGCYEKHRLYNDLLTAKTAMRSAWERRGSIGCHCREDTLEEAPYRIEIKKNAGRMQVLRKPV